MTGPEEEAPHAPSAPGFADAVSISFADPAAQVFGLAHLGLVPGEPTTANVLAVVFSGRAPVSAVARGDLAVDAYDWTRVGAGGVALETVEPLTRWRLGLDLESVALELELSATGPASAVEAEGRTASAGGLTGYEQLCRVEGAGRVAGAEVTLDGVGQRGHAWGAADWARLELARNVSAWFEPGRGVTVSALRPAGAAGHGDEVVEGLLFEDGPDDAPAPLDEARLSTTYDGEGRHRRAGLELWATPESERPRRLEGEVLCGSTLDLGALRLDCAFLRWSMHGLEGVGRYDVLRRA